MKTIIWDVDDVLNDHMRVWLKEFLASDFNYDDIKENPPHKLLRMSLDEYFASIDSFRNSKQAQEMLPIPEVLEWFKKNGNKYNHIALTARPVNTVFASANWVFKHFAQWIKTFAYVPANRPVESNNLAKSEYIKWLAKGNIFIDDSLNNIESVKRLGLETILFPRPWNNGQGDVLSCL